MFHSGLKARAVDESGLAVDVDLGKKINNKYTHRWHCRVSGVEGKSRV